MGYWVLAEPKVTGENALKANEVCAPKGSKATAPKANKMSAQVSAANEKIDMKIAIGGDHAGFPYKDPLKKMLEKMGHEVTDYGTNSPESVDYPDYIHPLASAMEEKKHELAVIICGSGNGVAITANKHQHVRAAVCWKVELAELGRKHNNANAISIPARFVSLKMAKNMVKAFISTDFEGGRHARRVGKIPC